MKKYQVLAGESSWDVVCTTWSRSPRQARLSVRLKISGRHESHASNGRACAGATSTKRECCCRPTRRRYFSSLAFGHVKVKRSGWRRRRPDWVTGAKPGPLERAEDDDDLAPGCSPAEWYWYWSWCWSWYGCDGTACDGTAKGKGDGNFKLDRKSTRTSREHLQPLWDSQQWQFVKSQRSGTSQRQPVGIVV